MPVTLDTYALTDLDTARDHLGIAPLVTTDDEIIKRYINVATFELEKKLDRKIVKRQYTETQDGRNSSKIMLTEWPADKPTELRFDASSDFTGADSLQDATNYVIEQSMFVALVNGLKFPHGTQNIRVIYEAGYDAAAIPWDIQQACLYIMEWHYRKRQNRDLNITGKTKLGENVSYLTDYPDWLMSIIEQYARGPFDMIANAPVLNV